MWKELDQTPNGQVCLLPKKKKGLTWAAFLKHSKPKYIIETISSNGFYSLLTLMMLLENAALVN